jgi:phytoene dehydrogenase-like protein
MPGSRSHGAPARTGPSSDEALVIGAGAGGLFTALLLAKLGHRVTVLERGRRPGGLMNGYVRQGIDCPVGVHYLGAMGEGQPLRRIFDFLGLTEAVPLTPMGAGVDGVVDRYLFDGQAPFDLPADLDLFEQRLRRAFEGEAEQVTAVMASLRRANSSMHALDFLFDDAGGAAPGEKGRRSGAAFRELRPLGPWLEELGCSAGLRRVLGMTSAWMGVPLAQSPLALHHMILCSYLASTWRLTESGTQMARAFTARLEALGGTIRCDAAVTRILVDLPRRAVQGVELASGEQLRAPLVVGAVHPKVIVPMLPDGATKSAYRNRIAGLEDTQGIFCVQATVPAGGTQAPGHNTLRWVERAGPEEGEILFYQLRPSNKEGLHLLTILGPDGAERWADGPGGERRPGYAQDKAAEAERLLQSARQIYGALDGTCVIDAYTPLSIRDWVNSPGGSAYGVLRSSRQRIRTALLNRTPVKGLLLAGQSAFAPGIFGVALGALRTVGAVLGRERARAALAPIFAAPTA